MIEGVTTTNSVNMYDGLILVAKIKKGAPQNDKGHAGRDLDRFRIDWRHPIYQKRFESIFKSKYGTTEPVGFYDVVFLDPNPDNVFSSWMELYGTGQKLKLRCTGKTVVKERTATGNDFNHKPCYNNPDKPCGCKQVGRLSFMLRDFTKATGLQAYFTLETHAWDDIRRIYASIMAHYTLTNDIMGVDWILERLKESNEVQKRDKQGNPTGWITKTEHPIYLRPNENDFKHLLMGGYQSHSLPSGTENTGNLLASGNAPVDTVEDMDDTDDTADAMTIDVDKFTELVQNIFPDANVTDVLQAFADVDLSGDIDRNELIARFAWYWCGQDKPTAKQAVTRLCALHDSLSEPDAQIELERIANDGA